MPSETPQERLGALAESLGFKETPELEGLRHQITASQLPDEVIAKYREYHRIGQEVVGQLQGEAYSAAQLGLTIALARIWRGWGDNDRFIYTINDALTHADNIGPQTAARELGEMLASAEQDRVEVRKLLQLCAEVIDREDLDELKNLPLEYALAAVYTLLYAIGQDADEFLQAHGFEAAAPIQGGA